MYQLIIQLSYLLEERGQGEVGRGLGAGCMLIIAVAALILFCGWVFSSGQLRLF